MPNIAEYSIKNRLIMWIIIAASLCAGVLAYKNMPRFEDPEFTIRTAQILTPYPGGSPDEVAREVTTPLETALQDLAEVKEIRSLSSDGFSEISVEIKYEASTSKERLQSVWGKLRNKIDDAASSLPPGAGPSQVYDEFGDVFGIYYILTGDGYSPAELQKVGKIFRQELLTVKGVGKVNLRGVQDEAIYVEISRQNAARLGSAVNSVFNQLSTQNAVVDGGSVQIGQNRMIITPTGDIDSVDAIKSLLVASSDGRVTQLGDIATVTRSYKDPTTFKMYYDGKPALAIGIAAVTGSNIVAIGKNINRKLEELQDLTPLGVEVHKFYHQGEVVEKSVKNFVMNVTFALIIVIGALIIFMGVRSGIVIGAGLLLTIAATLGTMYAVGIPMHRISLGALIIALGMLVDNAIVVTDGILIGIQKGRQLINVAKEIVQRSIWPLFGGTAVGILAFAPIGLAPGETAEFTGDLFWVIFISLMYSWIFAVTITPFLCDLLFTHRDHNIAKSSTGEEMPDDTDISDNQTPSYTQPNENKLLQQFKRTVHYLLIHRTATLLTIISLFLGSILAFQFVTPGFFPASTTPQMVVDYWLPEGTDISETEIDMHKLSAYIGEQEGVDHVHTLIGGGTLRYMLTYQFESSNSAYGQLLIQLDDHDRLDRLIPSIQNHIDENYPQAQGKVWRFQLGPGGGSKIEAQFSGTDPKELRRLANKAKEVFQNNPGTLSIKDDWRQKKPFIEAVYSDVKGRRAGVSRTDLGNAIARNYSGQHVGVYRENDDLIPILSRAPIRERNNIESITAIQLLSASGKTVPLGQITDGVRTVWRDGRLRKLDKVWTIKAQTDPRPGLLPGKLQEQLQAEIEAIPLPPEYHLAWKGESGNSAEANEQLASAIPFGFGAMVLVVILLFNAIRQPLIIWAIVPIALIGVVAGLLITNVPFEFMAILGVLSLAGLLIKNAIVLVDQIDLEIYTGKPRIDAIIDSAASRLRPVLLGSGTTVLGVIPLFFDAFFQSMAVVLVFGLSFATVLTLLILPVIYATIFGVNNDETSRNPRGIITIKEGAA